MSLEETLSNVDQDPLHVSVSWVDETTMMVVDGEVDMATVPLLHDRLENMVVPGLRGGLVIDLSGVTFLDSSGLAFLIAADTHVKAHGGQLVIYSPSRPIRRLFEITGLNAALTIVPDDSGI